MKKICYRIVTGLLLLIWMVIIFRFSAQPATESQQISGSLSYRIVSVCEQFLRIDVTEEELVLWAEKIDYPIRKVAHMTEYAILAVLCCVCIMGYAAWNKRLALYALLISFCYAMSDEIHQLFVPGRAGRMSDVCIDTIGAALGIGMCSLLVKIMRKHCEKKGLLLK